MESESSGPGSALRVLLVTGSFPPMACGVGDYTAALAAALAGANGTQVAVLTTAGVEAPAGAPYALFPVIRGWSRDETSVLDDVVRRWRPDVVHVQLPTRGYQGALPFFIPVHLRLRGVHVVQTWHEHFVPARSLSELAFRRWHDVALLLFGRDVIVVRPDYRSQMPRAFRALSVAKRFHLIPNAPSLPRVTLDDRERVEVRNRLGVGERQLLVFFGLPHEHKGIDDALVAMDPAHHLLAIVGDLDASDPYQARLLRQIREPPLCGSVTVAGFLPPREAARVLAAADAVVLPFRRGGGSWNTSLKAAALQGTFVLTTSTSKHGYDAEGNVYWARPNDPGDLSIALERYAGKRLERPSAELTGPDWREIAQRHLAVYRLNG